MRKAVILLAPLLMAQAEPKPLVPEGIHHDAKGPSTLCGITGASALDVEQEVRATPTVRYAGESDKFVIFDAEGSEGLRQWVFSKPTYVAYSLATCRRAYPENGMMMMQRDMRCEDTREDCDRAFLEFQSLDKEAVAAIRAQQ